MAFKSKGKSKGYPDGAIRLALWSVVVIALIITYFDANPVYVPAEDEVSAGAPLLIEASGDVLLVVDLSAFPTAPQGFDEMDFSLAWYNTLQQEIGPVTVVDAAQFSELNLSKYRVVIITRSAAYHDAWTSKLESFVNTGNVLVLEMPVGRAREKFSADGKSGQREPQRITRVEGLSDEYMDMLKEVPLHTRLIGSTNYSRMDDTETLMTIDAIPVVYRRKFGKGWAITFDFDYGMLLTSIQQGRPTDGFRIRNRRGTDAIETVDLALSDALTTSITPVADVLERFVVYGVLDPCYPIVGLWPFYGGKNGAFDGAFIVTHDERGLGDSASWMAEYEKTFEGRSTYFVHAEGEITGQGLAALTELGVDIGVTWDWAVGDSKGAFKPIGFGPIEPMIKGMTLAEQVEQLKKRNSGDPLRVLSVRTRDHLWDRDWAWPFRVMAAANLRADASYAPSPGEVGFPFGTGLPFTPLDQSGLVFNIQEFPSVLIAQGSKEEQEKLENLLERSQASDHQAIGVSVSPSAFRDNPSAGLYLTWRNTYTLALERNHWITSASKFLRFHLARQDSTLGSQVVESKVDKRDVTLLRLATLAKESGMYCVIPSQIGARTFSEARRGLTRVQSGDDNRRGLSEELLKEKVQTREVSIMGYKRLLLPLSKGFNAIDVIYQ
jgi:hypothetical protein